MENKNYISIFFDDEVPLLKAVKELKSNNIEIIDVFSPFPVHGMDKALEFKQTRIPTIGFIFGALGAIVGFGFQAWVFTTSYPLNIGGKPLLAVPSFIPVTFEITILFAALSMVAALFIRSKLKPKQFSILKSQLHKYLNLGYFYKHPSYLQINKQKHHLVFLNK